MMETLFIGGFLLIVVLIILLNIYIFQWLAKHILSPSVTFKRAFLILLIWAVLSLVVGYGYVFLLSLILTFSAPPSIIVNIVGIFISFGVFYFVLNRFNQTSFLKATGLVVAYLVASTIIIALPTTFIVNQTRELFEPFVVSGQAMNPTLYSGDYLVIKKNGNIYERGDIVVYKYDEEKFFVHRVVGLPGEQVGINNGKVFIDDDILDESYTVGFTNWDELSTRLGNSEYFLMGDNREHSFDSRSNGAITADRFFGEYLTKINILSQNDLIDH